MEAQKLKSFTQLDAWRKSHQLVVTIFKCCERMPKYDGLRNQMERCAVSVTSNIAEGFGRQSHQDKKHFYVMARGSIYELRNLIIVARDTNKISEMEYNALSDLASDSTRLLHGLIRSLDKG